MTIEQFFRDNAMELTEGTVGYINGLRGKSLGGSSFVVTLTEGDNGQPVKGYIRPEGRHGDTINFTVKDNQLIIDSALIFMDLSEANPHRIGDNSTTI